MLDDEAGDVRIVTGKNQPHEIATDRGDRPHQVFEDVGIVNADLQHYAAGHALCGVTPRTQVDLSEPIAADVGLGVDELAERARVDLAANVAKLALPASLVA